MRGFCYNDDDVISSVPIDFIYRIFEIFMCQTPGLDRHENMREFVFGNYKKLVYTAQIEEEVLKQQSIEIADKPGLEFEYSYCAYGDLSIFILAF